MAVSSDQRSDKIILLIRVPGVHADLDFIRDPPPEGSFFYFKCGLLEGYRRGAQMMQQFSSQRLKRPGSLHLRLAYLLFEFQRSIPCGKACKDHN